MEISSKEFIKKMFMLISKTIIAIIVRPLLTIKNGRTFIEAKEKMCDPTNSYFNIAYNDLETKSKNK